MHKKKDRKKVFDLGYWYIFPSCGQKNPLPRNSLVQAVKATRLEIQLQFFPLFSVKPNFKFHTIVSYYFHFTNVSLERLHLFRRVSTFQFTKKYLKQAKC